MAENGMIPRPSAPAVDRDGRLTREWYAYLQSLLSADQASSGDIEARLAELAREIQGLAHNFQITAGPGITVQGTPEGGLVRLSVSASGVTPGTYANATVTVGADGRVTAAEDGERGNLVAGSNVTLSGTLTGRLVGAGDITITATGGGGGGGGFPYTPPPDTGWSWVNQGAATLTSDPDFQKIEGGAAGSLNCRIRVRSAPATPYVIDSCIEPTMTLDSQRAVAVLWRNSSTGQLIWCGLLSGSFTIVHYSSPTSFSNIVYSAPSYAHDKMWVRIADDGTNRTVSFSGNGYDYILVYSAARATFTTPDQVGFMTLCSASEPAPIARLVHWLVS